MQLADGLKKVGEKYNATAGQVGLAWLLAQGNDIIPIPGTTKIHVSKVICSTGYRLTNGFQRLEENLGAVKVQLSPADLQEVRAEAERADAQQGDRYPAGMVEMLFGDTPAL